MLIDKNHSLLRDNTFHIDQKCDEYVAFANLSEAIDLAMNLKEPYLLLGGGSNLLLTSDFHGKIVTPEKRFDIAVELRQGCNEPYLRCWAGTTFDDVVDYAVRHGYYGLENLSLIPGECGASAIQNIGAYGAEIKDVMLEVEAVEIGTGRVVRIKADDCGYAYRQSKFKNEWKDKYIVVYVTYKLSRVFKPELDYGNIRKQLADRGMEESQLTGEVLRGIIIDIRQSKLPDPSVKGNAGSFFMNPIVDGSEFDRLKKSHPDLRYFEVPQPDGETKYKIPAGWMIEQCGWKGKSLGRAAVYDKQALILVNNGGASGKDVVALMKAVQKAVYDKFGLEIRPEVNIV